MLYKMSIGNRIKQARGTKGWSQTQLAETLNISRAACSQWEREISAPSLVRMRELAHLLDVNFEWLVTGRGEQFFTAGTEVSSNAKSIAVEMSQTEAVGALPDKQFLLERYARLTSREKRVIDELLALMTEKKILAAP